MKTVHKYVISTTETATVAMPDGAEFLHLDMQRGLACIWARIDTDAPMTKRNFRWVGTGQGTAGCGNHVGTLLVEGGALVVHLFEVTP